MKSTDSQAENHLHKTEPRWFAVYTRYKREKLVAERLEEKGISTYLPLKHFVREYAHRKKKVAIPVISCYVFTRITAPQYVPVLDTDDVVDFVRFSKNLISIPEEEIRTLREVIEQDIDLEVRPGLVLRGDPVEIVHGPLAGMTGKVVETKNDKNFVIELVNMGYSLHLTVEPGNLRKGGRPAGE